MDDKRKFIDDIVQRNSKDKTFMVTNSWGSYDIFKYIRHKGWYNIGQVISQKLFHHITSRINKLLAEEVSKGHLIQFPQHMGELGVKRCEASFREYKGKIYPTGPIDWKSTLDLWYEDKEAKDKKIVLRYSTTEDYYRIKYRKEKANYTNRIFYKFTVMRHIKRKLKECILRNEIETLW